MDNSGFIEFYIDWQWLVDHDLDYLYRNFTPKENLIKGKRNASI